MKVEVTKEDGFKYKEEEYEQGDILEMDDDDAEKGIEKEIVKKAEEESSDSDPFEIEKVEIQDDQVDKIDKLAGKIGVSKDEVDSMAKKDYGVSGVGDLSKSQASKFIDTLTSKAAKEEAGESSIEEAAEEIHSWPGGEAGMKAAQKMVKKDRQQIAREVAGGDISKATVDEYFYQFRQGGETVTGPTYKGIMAIFREQGNIDIITKKIWEDGDHIYVRVKAVDKANNSSIERTVKEPKNKRFAMRMAESEAQKKAVRALVDDEVLTQAYAKWKKEAEE
jgi:hypothetical protein